MNLGECYQISGDGNGVCRKSETIVSCGMPSFRSDEGTRSSGEEWTQTFSFDRSSDFTVEANASFTLLYASN